MKPTALIFSGQGAQYVGMGRDLAETYPFVFELYKEANAILEFDLAGTCFEGPEERLTGTDYCQPALYVHGLALLKVLQDQGFGFCFDAVAGLSLGEFTAHVAAGTLSFEDGLKLVAARGKFMQEACKMSVGGMVSLIGATHTEAEQVAQECGLEVANYNCPGQIVLSGKKENIPSAVEFAKKIGLKRAIPLNVAGAYHSSLMKPAQDQLKPILEKTQMTMPTVGVASNVTGMLVESVDEIRDLLLRQVTSSVRWESCIHTLLGYGVERFIELGPGKVLQGLCRRIDKNIDCLSFGNLEDLQSNLNAI
ncbi:MAG: ACP S-malonyltransferase [Verrucomicrobiota bacterium]